MIKIKVRHRNLWFFTIGFLITFLILTLVGCGSKANSTGSSGGNSSTSGSAGGSSASGGTNGGQPSGSQWIGDIAGQGPTAHSETMDTTAKWSFVITWACDSSDVSQATAEIGSANGGSFNYSSHTGAYAGTHNRVDSYSGSGVQKVFFAIAAPMDCSWTIDNYAD